MEKQKTWFVYIAECRNKMFYVGITKDVQRRIEEHNRTSRCRYTRYRKPLVLKYYEPCGNYGAARKREAEVKSSAGRRSWT